jgi:DNA-binding MarR family transcriptional regulator
VPSPAVLGVVRVGDDFATEYPDGDRVQAEVMATLVRTGNSLIQEIERSMLATFGVPQTVLNALAIIDGADEPLTPTQISERSLVSSATMTGTLDTLEWNGWIRRVPNPDDRRSLLIEITDEGRAVADQLLPGIRRLEQRVLGTLSQRELQSLMATLGKVLANIAEVADGEPVRLEGIRIRRPRRP